MKTHLIFEAFKDPDPRLVLLCDRVDTPAGLIHYIENFRDQELRVRHLYGYLHQMPDGSQVDAIWFRTRERREFIAVQCSLTQWILSQSQRVEIAV